MTVAPSIFPAVSRSVVTGTSVLTFCHTACRQAWRDDCAALGWNVDVWHDIFTDDPRHHDHIGRPSGPASCANCGEAL